MTSINKHDVQTAQVLFKDIIRDEKFNMRSSYDDIDVLAKSIDTHGLMNPLNVWKRKDGSLYLLSGFRRAKAIELNINEKNRKYREAGKLDKVIDLDSMFIPVAINSHIENEEEALAINLAENLQRDDCRKYDIVRRVYHLDKVVNLKRSAIASRIGKSQPEISNMVNCWERLIDPIKDFWGSAKDRSKEIPFSTVFKWSSLEPAQQEEALKNYLANNPETDGSKKRGPRQKTGKPGEKVILASLETLKTVHANDPAAKYVVAALEWILGKAETPLPGFTPPVLKKGRKAKDKSSNGISSDVDMADLDNDLEDESLSM